VPQREQQSKLQAAGSLNFFSEPGCLTIEAAADAGADGKPGSRLPRFSMIAYTGSPMRVLGWRYPVIIDLAGLAIPSQSRPIRFGHDMTADVGHTDAIVRKYAERNAAIAGADADSLAAIRQEIEDAKAELAVLVGQAARRRGPNGESDYDRGGNVPGPGDITGSTVAVRGGFSAMQAFGRAGPATDRVTGLLEQIAKNTKRMADDPGPEAN